MVCVSARDNNSVLPLDMFLNVVFEQSPNVGYIEYSVTKSRYKIDMLINILILDSTIRMSDRNNTVEEDDGYNPNEYEDDEDDDEGEQPQIDPRSVATLYLKEMAHDRFVTPWDKLAEQMDIPQSQADSIIKQLVQTMVGTHRESNFPRRLLAHYNRYAPRPTDELTQEDVVILMRLIDRYVKKIDAKDMAKIHDKMKKLGTVPQEGQEGQGQVPPRNDPRDESGVIPVPDIPHRRVAFTDSYNSNSNSGQNQNPQGVPPPTMGQAPPPQAGQAQQGDVYSPFENEESLLKYFLEMNYTIRDPQRISRFLQFFRTNKAGFLANPISLLVALKGMFGDRAAEATMQMFMDARQKLPTTAGSLYRITGASDYKPIIDPTSYLGQANPALTEFMNQYGSGNQFGAQQPFPNVPFQGHPEDPLDKELQRLSKIIGMTMMKGMAQPGAGGAMGGGQNGQSYDPSLYDVHEVFDAAGRMTERRLVRKGFPTFPGPTQNPSGSDATTQMMMKFMETMLNTANSDRQLIMNKMLSGDSQGGMNSVMETMLKQFAGVMTQQIDPSVALTKYLDLGEKVAALRQQPQKSAEERRLEMDFLLAKQEMAAKEQEKQREYERQREEATSADNRYQDTVKQVGDIIKEAAGPAIEIFKNTMGRGLGGNMPGMFPPAGYPPQQQQQERVIVQQMPPEPTMQQRQQVQQQQQPQYTPEQLHLLRQEQIRQQQEAQRQADFENRPIDDVIGEIPDDQLEEMARQFGDDMIRMEHTGNKVMAELARRKGHGFTPRRQHVAPIIQAVAEHEHQQQQAAQHYAQQYQEPEEPSINVFEDEPHSNTNATSGAVDFSNSYDDENVRESLKVEGLLSKDDEENEEHMNIDENQSIGVPSSTSMPPTKSREEVQMAVVEEPEPVVEIDESSIVDDSDTVIEQ